MAESLDAGRSSPLERAWPETWALDELRLLGEFLQFLRVTAVNKLAGLDPVAARGAPIPTSPLTTPLGIVKHLTSVERFWVSIVAGGRDLPDPWASDDADVDFRLAPDDTPAAVVHAYREEWARSDEATASMAADDETKQAVGGKRRTIRWVYAHVIQETARHVGHLDLLREMADGQVGE